MCREIQDSSFDNEVIDSDSPVLVDFFTPYCKHCPSVENKLEKIAKDGIKIVKMDVLKSPSTASKYSIMSVPTVMSFENGRVTNMLTGVRGESEYAEMIN